MKPPLPERWALRHNSPRTSLPSGGGAGRVDHLSKLRAYAQCSGGGLVDQPQRASFRVLVTTPLFMGGSDPAQPELRAASVRGALRYWLRAAVGGVVAGDVPSVRAAEATVFGAAADTGATGGQSHVSAVMIRLQVPRFSPTQLQRDRPVFTTRNGKRLIRPSGRDYLYWSMLRGGRDGNVRACIPPGTRFTMDVMLWPGFVRGRAEQADGSAARVLRSTVAALWLLSRLGGLGARSRRCAGNVAVEVEGGRWDELSFASSARSADEAATELASGLATVRKWMRDAWGREPFDPTATPEFDVLHPDHCRIWVLGLWSTWEDAVKAIGSALCEFRSRSSPDRERVLEWARGRPIPTVERAIFGLPLIFRYSGGLTVVVEGRGAPPANAIKRRASPLWLSVWKIDDQRYAGVATLFKSCFLPVGERLYDNQRKRSVPAPSGFHLIEEFVAKKFAQAKEVRYG